MAKQTINIGSAANDGTGSTLRAAFDITNDNFTELYDGSGGLLHKIEGTNFTGSLLVGHSTTGTISSASNNTGIGIGALDALTSGDGNVALGYNTGTVVTEGSNNTLLGYNAGSSLTTGGSNIAIGNYALNAMDNGSTTNTHNTALGYYSGVAVTTGIQNTLLGALAGDAITTGGNNMVIGYNAAASAVDVSNEITLGDANISAFRCADQSIAALSDGRDKSEVEESPYGLEFINKLKPVKFTWDFRPEHMAEAKQGKSRVGFIAQDLQEAMPNNDNDILDLVYEISEDRLEAKYGNLIPIMAKAIQELSAEVKELKKQING